MNPKSRKPKLKKVKNYRRNKMAFDKVIERVREIMDRQLVAMDVDNPGRPTPIDFRVDVKRAIEAKIPKDIDLLGFDDAYLSFDSEDYIEREVHAHAILGDRRHSVEQRIGEEFLRRKLYPTRVYFEYTRKARLA
jgi:hypothetical protein